MTADSRRVVVLPAAVAVGTAVLVVVGLTLAQPDNRGIAALANAIAGCAVLVLVLNALTSGIAQRIVRTLAALAIGLALGGAGMGLLPADPVLHLAGALVLGAGIALIVVAVRQWFSEAHEATARTACSVLAAAAIPATVSLAAVAAWSAGSLGVPITALVAGLDVALVSVYIGSRSARGRTQFGFRALAEVAAVAGAAIAVAAAVLAPPPSWNLAGTGATDLLILTLGSAASIFFVIAAAWQDSIRLRRSAAILFTITLNAAALVTFAAQPADARAPMLAMVIIADLAIAARLAARWAPEESSREGPLSLAATVLTVIAANFAVLWCIPFLPQAGGDAAHTLMKIGDAGAILMIGARWLPPRWAFFTRRLVLGAVTIFIVTLVVFFLFSLQPPSEQWWSHIVYAKNNSPERSRYLMHLLGVDRPWYIQYLGWLNGILQWPPDLGSSQNLHDTTLNAILGDHPWYETRVGATVILLGASYLLQLIIAVPIGIISAVKQYSKLDNFVTGSAFVGISLPNYWFGTLLIWFLAVTPYQTHGSVIFPSGGEFTNPAQPGFTDLLWHLVLPAIVLAVQGIAAYARFIRSSMLDVLNQDFVRTARAKGLSPVRVTVRHAFRNSLLPLITLMGIDIPTIFVGAVITEFVFNWPGMGQFSVNEVSSGDTVPVIGILLILSVLVVVGSLVADLLYTVADPRIRYDNA